MPSELNSSLLLQETCTHSLAKHISVEKKNTEIKTRLYRLIKRFPDHFDESLLNEWNSISSLSRAFLECRSIKHLTHLTFVQWHFRKELQKAFFVNTEKRSLLFHLFPAYLESPFGKKTVFGLLVTVVYFHKHERLDEDNMLLAIQKSMPNVRLVQGSRYLYKHPQEERLCTLYVELDSANGRPFSIQERKFLKNILSSELKERIQTLTPLLFKVRNEERLMKNIVLLSRELDSSRSLPQLTISFEQQTPSGLIFTAILIYALTKEPLENRLGNFSVNIDISLERKKIVGYLKNGIPKVALVLQVKVSQTLEIFRDDFSVNVHCARQKTYNEICKIFGEVRDYDGGLHIKQEELLSQLEMLFPQIGSRKKELLENFFYAISPIEQQTSLPLNVLEKLFSLVIASLEISFDEKGAYFLKTTQDKNNFLLFLRIGNLFLKESILKTLSTLPFRKKITTTLFHFQETLCVGCILQTFDDRSHKDMLTAIKSTIESWHKEIHKQQILRLHFTDRPFSLDPRLAGDTISHNILKMLFEGLMSRDDDGKPTLCIAESIDISPDKQTYIFKLRDCKWSNGTPIRANDFEYAWKKILLPHFKTPFVHHFYPIKNAWAAKEGLVAIEEVGINSLSKNTLRVELTAPLPYFLELLTLPLFFPVNEAHDVAFPQWPFTEGPSFLCNGPFYLKRNQMEQGYLLEKNMHYHDSKHVHLQQILFIKANSSVAVQMFKNNELDWIGRPLQPWHASYDMAKTSQSEKVHLGDRAYWCTLNLRSFPFYNQKIRQALSMAINRQELTQRLNDGEPAFSLLQPKYACHTNYGISKEDPLQANAIFDEALKELDLTREAFPILHMIYPEDSKREQIAKILCEQWKKTLGIEVYTQGYEFSTLFKKIIDGDYEMASLSWVSLVNDPLYTLNAFKNADDPLNFSKWEKLEYQELIDFAMHEEDHEVRSDLIARAEAMLIEDSPIIPILYEKDLAIKNNSFDINLKSEYLDFKTGIFR